MNAFKGTLSNQEACEAVSYALGRKDIACRVLPIGDGGAGTLRTIHSTLGGEISTFNATGPLSRPVEAKVLCLPDASRPESVYIESAEVCGFHLVGEGERDAMRATSYGLGELIRRVVEQWKGSLRKIYVGLGDSATSDMGMGMCCSLGMGFSDFGGKDLWGNADGLRNIRTVRVTPMPELRDIRIFALCDVLNPLCGANGSARTFSRQKGASEGQIRLIEQGMENLAGRVQEMTGRDLKNEPMTGAAGGIAAAFLAFFNAELVHGARFLMDWIHFDRLLEEHELLITGEGTTDAQTLRGKAPLECLERARRLGKKTIVISGALGDGHEALLKSFPGASCFACGDKPSARDALYEKTLEVFSDPDLLERSNA
jgi:glycerate kinase